ncbi:MAG TPA: L-glutamate gamma-semialdehyde dehydrogenase [Phycisphaerae bacterium]|nr:L-glutamate gamma-semialdehyde dehydrogenase [Phycisphaerae bacterium]HRY71077.1 L-glutamate gamma-semialdehyde dehydrogenase [Phycisphaerae bacterium]HSA29748.1 L-glutamate gamma-semialdehyde dehydrogenase [Phycisphaerae bacterium]
MTQRPALEQRIRQIGAEILSRARSAEPSVLRLQWWMDRMLDWATADPVRKLQLFRFTDVLPCLTDDRAVARQMSEYLLDGKVPLPWPARPVLKAAVGMGWSRRLLAALTEWGATTMARSFIAGHTPEEAIQTVLALRRRGMAFTIDTLGEATTSDAQADRYAEQYLRLLDSLGPAARGWEPAEVVDRSDSGLMPRVNLSLKLTGLDPCFDPIDPERSASAVLGRLRPILRSARKHGAIVNIDLEQYRYRDLTLEIFRRIMTDPEFGDFADLGIVLQAYLQDGAGDLDRLLDWVNRRGTPITVRLVKGAYWDYEVFTAIQRGWPIPVLTQKWRSDAQYELMARRLLDHRQMMRPAFASHNIRSLAAAMAYAESIGASPRSFEVQMLFGMGDPLKVAVTGMGYTLRIYAPFGELIPGMAYLIRRLLENTANESFLKGSFRERKPAEQILADPDEVRLASAPLPEPLSVDSDEDEPMNAFTFEPHTDFSRADAREAMSQTLARVHDAFGGTCPLVIAGQKITTAQKLASLNPSRISEVVGQVCQASIEQADQAVAAARAAFKAYWLEAVLREGSAAVHAQRAALLRRVAAIMRQRRFELDAWIIYEVGKAWREADGDVAEAIDFCNYYADEIERISSRPRRRNFPGEDNLYAHQPLGVVAVISPWNFPLAILTGMTAAAVAAGNSAVMKPAGQSSVIAAKLMDIFTEAGAPPGVVNYLPGPGKAVGARLVEHPDVNLIVFTGSREVGCWMHEQAAKRRPGQPFLKRVIAEMGGKNAIIVDADADLDEAVVGTIASAFGYSGQKCSACSRVIVHDAVRETFVQRLVDAARSMVIGPADEPATLVGPVIDDASRTKIAGYIERGRQESKLAYLADLGKLADQGTFVPPAIFIDVPAKAAIAQEEIFGPVLAVMNASSFEEALEIANGVDYALTGGVYSRSPRHLELARRSFGVGNLYLNRNITGALVDRQPFGGYKMSGIGSKAGGPDYLLQFMEPRTVSENTLRHGFAPESTGASVTR